MIFSISIIAAVLLLDYLIFRKFGVIRYFVLLVALLLIINHFA